MEQNKKLFKIQFDEEDIQDMKPLDGILAIFYYLFYIILIFYFGLFIVETDVYENLGNILQMVICINSSFLFQSQ